MSKNKELKNVIEDMKDGKFINPQYLIDLLESALAEASHKAMCEQSEREGWVSVPIEPTHEMITRAFHLAQNPNTLIKDMYKAMIAVAPTIQYKEHDNEVIEKCAKVCDGYTHGVWFADKIRTLKG